MSVGFTYATDELRAGSAPCRASLLAPRRTCRSVRTKCAAQGHRTRAFEENRVHARGSGHGTFLSFIPLMRSPEPSVSLLVCGVCVAVGVSDCSDGPNVDTGQARDTGATDPGRDAAKSGDATSAVRDGGHEAGGEVDARGHDARAEGATVDAKRSADASAGHDAGGNADTSAPLQCGDPTPTCPGGLTCCAHSCVDIHLDPDDCGACGVACSATEYCTGTACAPLVLASVCQNPSATVSLDAYPVDVAAGSALGESLATACAPGIVASEVNETSPTLLDQATGEPIGGPGHTLIAGGGAFGQSAIAYLDQAGDSPVFVVAGATDALFVRRLGGFTLLDAPLTSLGPTHDYFTLYVAIDPKSGTLTLAAFGMLGPGTTAAAWYWQNVIAPNLATQTKAWYVVEWTGADAGQPGAGDSWTTVATGP